MAKVPNIKKRWRIIRPPLGTGFYLPSRVDLLNVKPGDDVKLLFQAGKDAPERMWVKVEECGDSDKWVGRLDNDPAQEYMASVLKFNDSISFHPLDVINIETDEDIPRTAVQEQVIDTALNDTNNSINQKWYKNPNIIVPAVVALIVGLMSLVGTLVAVLIAKK
jgi:hypothetical protein